MSRIEELQGIRWAKQICEKSTQDLRLTGGPERLLTILRRGLVDKPQGYAAGVLSIIHIVEDCHLVEMIRSKT